MVTVVNRADLSGIGMTSQRTRERLVQRLVEQLSVRPSDMKQKVSFLSGGNQQKIVVCKGLFTEAQIYIFAEPTAGVDVGAKTGHS